MNTKTIKTVLSIATLMVCTASYSKSYLSAQIGSASGNEIFVSNPPNDYKIGATGRLAAGHLWEPTCRFKLGVEAGIQIYQNIENKSHDYYDADGRNVELSIETKRWGLDVLGVADFFITKRFDLFAKLGTAFVQQSYSNRINGNTFYNGGKVYSAINAHYLESESRFVPKVAVGAGYNVRDNLNINLSINHEYKNQDHYVPGVRSVLLGLNYSFS